ncbi:MAG: hypothetical protein MJ124_06590 [Lachnospiraceae bacterium]|nr:hypothetical protein [Lachnospiraceae bacterium]
MKVIETKGILYIELLAENSQWYCGTDYANGDLYEAEEVYREGGKIKPNRVVFIHHPDGEVVEPIMLKENQYLGRPIQIEGIIYMLLVDFEQQFIRIIDCGTSFERQSTVTELPLSEVKDCYNLLLKGTPLMLTRNGGDNCFEIIWPRKLSIKIGDTEAFLYKRGDRLIFSRWLEDPDYREEVVARDSAGNVLEVISGSIFITPAGEEWILQ